MQAANNRLRKRARYQNKLRVINSGSKTRPALTSKADFIVAMVGTGGIISQIAKNLKSNWGTVKTLLEREDWADVRALFHEEKENAIDEAEETIRHAITQRSDIKTAARTAAWFLERMRTKRFGEKKIIVHEGGDTPIKSVQVQIPIQALNLPVEMQRTLLQAIDQTEASDSDGEIIEGSVI